MWRIFYLRLTSWPTIGQVKPAASASPMEATRIQSPVRTALRRAPPRWRESSPLGSPAGSTSASRAQELLGSDERAGAVG